MRLSQEQLRAALVERHGEAAQAKLDAAAVGIAGLGGLGSNIAIHLARLGVGRLVLADFDVVDTTNLNRQHYTMADLGVPKVVTLLEQLQSINPYLHYETYQERIVPENAAQIFAGCGIVCEAFDRADQKAMLIETMLTQTKDTIVVSGSGMAGYRSANAVQTVRKFQRLYVCGDGTSDVAAGLPLMAPRVALCAAHQATMVLRLILGETEA